MKSQQGFTLIELVIVMIIIGIFAAIAVPRYLDIRAQAMRAAKYATLDSVRTALAFSIGQDQDYPTPTKLFSNLQHDSNAGLYPSFIRFVIGGQAFAIMLYSDPGCTTLTTSIDQDRVKCVDFQTPP